MTAESRAARRNSRTRVIASLIILFVLVFGVAPCLLIGYHVSSTAPLYVVNGFDQPVEISVDATEVFVVEPYQMESVDIGSGEQTITSRFADGDLIEEIDFEMPGPWDRFTSNTPGVLYNVSGVGTPYLETVIYYDEDEFELVDGEWIHQGVSDPREGFESLIGRRIVILEDVEAIDEELPEEIYLSGNNELKKALYYDRAPLSASLWQVDYVEDVESVVDALAALIDWRPDDGDLFFMAIDIFLNLEDLDDQHHWVDGLAELSEEHSESIWLNVAHKRLSELTVENWADIERRYAEVHERRDSGVSALLLALVKEDRQRRTELLQRSADEIDSQGRVYHDEMVFQWTRLGECDSTLEHVRPLLNLWESGDPGYLYYTIPYARCLLELEREGVDVEPALNRLLELIAMEAYDEVYLEYAVRLIVPRIAASMVAEYPPVASEMGEEAFVGMGMDPLVSQKYFQLNDAGVRLDEDFRVEQEDSYTELIFSLNDAIHDGDAKKLVELYDSGSDHLDEEEIGYILERDTRVLIGLVALALQRDDLFDSILSDAYAMVLNEFLYSGIQTDIRILQEVRQTDALRNLEAPVPSHWDREYRVAYHVARAITYEDREERRRILQEALAEDPLWSPSKAFAFAKLAKADEPRTAED